MQQQRQADGVGFAKLRIGIQAVADGWRGRRGLFGSSSVVALHGAIEFEQLARLQYPGLLGAFQRKGTEPQVCGGIQDADSVVLVSERSSAGGWQGDGWFNSVRLWRVELHD